MGDNSGGYTLDEVLVDIGFGKFQVYVLAYAGLGFAAAAVETMILSFIGQSVKSQWKLSSTQESLLTSVIFAGILLGSYLSGFVSDNYGRRHAPFHFSGFIFLFGKINTVLEVITTVAYLHCSFTRKGLLIVAIVTSGAAFLSAFAPNYISLVLLRCLVGVGVGGGALYLSWFLEFIPVPNRGTWMVIFSTFWTVGIVIEASLAWIIMPILGWRWLLALSSVPAFATLLFYNLAPESPRYLCMKGQLDDAHNMIKRIATINGTELPSGILLSDQMTAFDEEDTSMTDPLLLSPKKTITTVSKTGFSTIRMLFSPSLIRTTLLLWALFFGNNFAYYGIILLTSELSSGQSQCNSVILHSDNSQDSSYRDILVASFAELPGIVLSAFIIDRIGRKLSMEIMFMIGFIFLLPLVLLQSEISSTIWLSGSRIFITGTYAIANVYAPEIYPTSVRATGVGLACAVGGVGGMLCPLVAVGFLNDCHQTAAIVLFESVIVLSGLCVFLFPLETKGQELLDNVSVI